MVLFVHWIMNQFAVMYCYSKNPIYTTTFIFHATQWRARTRQHAERQYV
jgi:hypothetical protein